MNFTVKQPLLVPGSDHHILSNDTIASSRGRDGGETQSEREQGNGGMRDREGEGTWELGKTRE
ncbi:hypothetical protein NC651_009949 [Populus alba x Populus x berolinensis]|nr:hypothetical protein NC651_009949 [Populus alba x Populus x berolinensis]